MPTAKISDLSRTIFENEFLPASFAADVLETNNRSYEERLASCKMISSVENFNPTILGLLSIGKSPQDFLPGASIQFLRIAGTELADPILQEIATDLYLLPGDVGLSGYEDFLSSEWPSGLRDNNLYRPMRILSSFWQILQMAAQKIQADIILVDIGPNLGAINRSVLIATDYVAIPLGADLFSLQGLKNLGPTLRRWKNQWQKRLDNFNDSNEKNSFPDFKLPHGKMQPIGYLCQQHGVRLDRPVKAYDKWIQRIPKVYREYVLSEPVSDNVRQENDPCCLATIKHYRSLISMAQEHRKPIFNLTSADGAIGSHANAVQDAKADFNCLARIIAAKTGIKL